MTLVTFKSAKIVLVLYVLFGNIELLRCENRTMIELNSTLTNSSFLLYNMTSDNSTGTNSSDNSTETDSTDNSTDIYNVTTDELTTVEPELTTFNPEEILINLRPRELGYEDYCTCDLKSGSCDINCCCDKECSTSDKDSFSQCLSTSSKHADERYCYQDGTLIGNNTDFKTRYSTNGFFCIVTDNLKDANIFPSIEEANTVEEFNKKASTSKHFSWMYHPLRADKENKHNYVHGSPVLAIDGDGMAYEFELPSSFLGSSCDRGEIIRYLTDFESLCEVPAFPSLKDCEHPQVMSVEQFLKLTFLGEILQPEIPVVPDMTSENSTTELKTTTPMPTTKITAATADTKATTKAASTLQTTTPTLTTTTAPTKGLENTTSKPSVKESSSSVKKINNKLLLKNSSNVDEEIESNVVSLINYNLVTIKFTVCEQFSYTGFDYCSEKKIEPVCCQNGVCKNVLQAIEFQFRHNGTQGIKEVWAKLFLTSIYHSKPFLQYFKVSFQWLGDNETEVFQRSGSPGYITGKPILLGRLLTNESSEGESEKQSWIEMDKNPKNWLTLISTASDFSCNRRIQVNFRENLRTGCLIPIPSNEITHNCKELRKNIVLFMLGPILQDLENLKVGMYGDSNLNIPEEWVSLLLDKKLLNIVNYDTESVESNDVCANVITAIEIEIAFVYQGPFSNPQAKIVGAFINSGPVKDLFPVCSNGLMCSRLLEEEKSSPISVELSSSVIFIDVSKSAERQYPQPPAFDIKLPHDFFYPFLPSIASSNSKSSPFFRLPSLVFLLKYILT